MRTTNKNVKRLVVLLFFSWCLCRGTASEPQSPAKIESLLKGLGYEPVALQLTKQRHLTVRAFLAQKERRFLLDTGRTTTLVDTTVATKFKTHDELSGKLQESVLGQPDRTNRVLIDRLRLGSVQFTNQPAWPTTMGAAGLAEKGVLGCDFLMRNFCLIDCLGRRLYVRDNEPSERTRSVFRESLRRSGFHEMPLELQTGLGMTCVGKLDNHELRLIVSTAAFWNTLDKSQVARLNLKPQELIPGGPAAHVFGAETSRSPAFQTASLKILQFGDLNLNDVEFGISDMGNWDIPDLKKAMQDIHGVVGAELLTRCDTIIDCHAQRLWIRVPTPKK